MQASLDDIVKSLEVIRATQGEEAYLRARDSLAVMLINQPRGEEFLNMAFPGLDLEPIRQRAAEAEAQKKTAAPPNDMLALIRTHVPHLQTQAQLDTFMLAFNAFTLVFDSYFAGNFESGDRARESLSKTLDLAHQVGQMGAQVNEIPPEARSDEASKFVEPPKQFTEADEKNQLMAELGSIMTKRGLNEWYQSERKRIDGVVSKRLRDELFDAIRAKDQSLLN